MSSMNTRQVIKMSARTWTRDSHGLFDYETTGYTYSTLFLDSTNQLFRQRLDGKIVNSTNPDPDLSDELLITVNKTNDTYSIDNALPNKNEYPSLPIIKELTQKAWYILNSDQQKPFENEDYYLNQFDVIKLGRVKYVVTEYKVKQQPTPEKKESSYNISYENSSRGSVFNLVYQTERFEESRGQQQEKLCKICYMNDNEQDNPLINLCGCTGGIRFIHFQCLKTWMQTKLAFKENLNHNAKSYMLKGFNCEICQKAYPFKFKFKDEAKEYSLVDIKVPFQGEYLVLESLNQMKDKVNTKIIHVINLTQEQYVIGRGHECDVRINDISVSRAHAYLKFNKSTKRIMIKDLKSKFGTLVLLKAPLSLTNKPIHLQVGRTVFNTQIVPRSIAEVPIEKDKLESKKTADIDECHDVIMNDVNEKEETVIENKDGHLNNSVNGDDDLSN